MFELLEERKASKLDTNSLIACLTLLKQLQAECDMGNDADEYLDAFVALGGNPDKTGCINKRTLIEIIKEEFELTIDMVEFLHKMEGDNEQIEFHQFC